MPKVPVRKRYKRANYNSDKQRDRKREGSSTDSTASESAPMQEHVPPEKMHNASE